MRKYDASIADKPSPLRPGDLLDGKYRILSVLGQGGMGTVYKARHVELGVDRAIKLMKGDVDESARFRFTREAHIAARIHFPSIATLYDVGSYEGSLFTVWEYVPGVTLGQVLRHGPVHWRVAIYVVGQVLNALVHVHRMQVLHRDVAPSNIMLYVSDQDLLEVKLIDFGIAKEALARDRDRDITSEGLFVGTPRYAAPEQLTGHGFTPAGDVYSAGVVLYQMITGTVPFEAEGHALEMVQKLTVPVRGLPHHRWIGEPEDDPPLELDPVIARALAIDPEQRYRSADEFLDELWGVASPQLTDEVEKFTRLVRSLYAGRDKPINSADQITRESAVVPAVPSLVVVADPSDIATGMFPIAKAAPQIVPASLPADDGHTLQNVRLLPLDASADSPAVRKIREGTQIGGFEVERLIGEGPRTAVFLARNPASLLDRRVVLKVPHRQRLDAKELDALRHDVKVWSFLSVQEYKGVLRLHEAARYDDLTVLVVDYFEGESLADVMKRVHANGPLPPGDAIALIRAICDALDPMHRKNLHHGNLKPANVLLVAGGVKLTDFLMRDRSVADAGNTPYLAPEVEHTAGSVRADVYAVGAMLYELLHAKTGEDDWPV
ncbi:MAG TPA: protein kinase, partial [Thermoanaerobaculia bacterium]